ncbi:MAG: exodeoxyribonuclease VII large subunit [Hyphomicrobiales bacterium]
MEEKRIFITLSQLADEIKQTIDRQFKEKHFWIVAEISGFNLRKGHCYLSLIEKNPESVYPKAEFRGIIWSRSYPEIARKFESVTGESLKENMKILFRAIIHYDNKFGMALYIEDIEPGFTLGQMELDRKVAIEKLKKEGIYDLNKRKELPPVINNIAIISNTDSKGFEDFQNKIDNNPFGYKIAYKLFPSLLQGEKAAADIRNSLIKIFHEIKEEQVKYDIVLILRGGGGNINLNCFNNYNLARAVARFPLAVITGIGHTTNISIIDEVAHTRRNTPTDVADFIINRTREYEISIDNTISRIVSKVRSVIPKENEIIQNRIQLVSEKAKSLCKEENLILNNWKSSLLSNYKRHNTESNQQLKAFIERVSIISNSKRKEEDQTLNVWKSRFQLSINNSIEKENSALTQAKQQIRLLDPINILKRGYSISYVNNELLLDPDQVEIGKEIEVKLYKGSVISTVKSKIKKDNGK